jgi:hypothetical protein
MFVTVGVLSNPDNIFEGIRYVRESKEMLRIGIAS